ncbi:hypothetical protein, partial [Pectobacterium parmentieri]
MLLSTARRTARRLALLRTSRPFFGSHGVAALPGGAGSGVNLQQTSTSTEQGVVGLTASAERR